MKLTSALRQDLKNYLKAKLSDMRPDAHIYAAYELSDTELAEMKSKYELLEGTTIHTHVDTNLIAGFVIEVGSKRIDCSVKNRLRVLFA
jgi:F0F1-type ATP synthase delta subunit